MKFKSYLSEQSTLTKTPDVRDWLDVHDIKRYKVELDGSVEVFDNVSLWDTELTSLPIRFTQIHGYFSISHTKLTAFDNFPHTILGYCSIANNIFTSLEGINDYVKRIKGHFAIDSNKIQSGGLGLVLIDGILDLINLSSDSPANDKPFAIIKKYLGKSDKIFECQEELIAAGFEKFALL